MLPKLLMLYHSTLIGGIALVKLRYSCPEQSSEQFTVSVIISTEKLQQKGPGSTVVVI